MSNYFPATHSILSVDALTTEVLPRYGLGPIVDFKFLKIGDTYAIKTADGASYFLRVYYRDWRSLSAIAYEVEALNHLSGKGIPVIKPLPQTDRSFIQTVTAPEGPRHLVLFTYALGKKPAYAKAAETEAFTYGQTAAKLHNATQDFVNQHPPFPLDVDHLIDAPLKAVAPLLAHRPSDWAYLQQLAAKLRQQLHALPHAALAQGFCHGDFNGGNAHFAEDGSITFFDFSCCGWGWRAYDLAAFRLSARDKKQEKELWEPFLRGYTTERSLQPLDLQAIPLLMGVRYIWVLGSHTNLCQYMGFRWMSDRYFDEALAALKGLEAAYFAETPQTQA